MPESVPDALLKVADVLHFLGRYRDSNNLVLLSRWLRARGIDTDEVLKSAVLAAEADVERSLRRLNYTNFAGTELSTPPAGFKTPNAVDPQKED